MADIPPPLRIPGGRFAPGRSGNPGGRVGLPGDLRQQLEDGAPMAVARLVELIGAADERVALAASEALLSRLYGRPAMAVDATITKQTDIGQAHLKILQDIAVRRVARLTSETTKN
jgi:hypothetical protein